MSYNAEVAKKPLTGEAYDLLILQEREQRHMIGNRELKGFHIMPSKEYCELRDVYKKLIEEREAMPAYPIRPGDMTLEQAIAILEPETTRAALYEYQYYGGFSGEKAKIKACEEACRIAAAVMRREVSRKRREENR